VQWQEGKYPRPAVGKVSRSAIGEFARTAERSRK
jgi:hypothetical protein